MSEHQSAWLKRERSYLKIEHAMIGRMLCSTTKHDPKHWDYLRQQDSLQKEMNRISHQLKHSA